MCAGLQTERHVYISCPRGIVASVPGAKAFLQGARDRVVKTD